MKKFYIVLAAVLAALFVFAGCTGKTEETQAESSADGIIPFSPLTEIEEGRKNIYLIIKSAGNSYWNSVVSGAKYAGDAYDCNVYMGGITNETDSKGQAELIYKAAANNADAIVLAPIGSKMVVTAVEKAYDANIPIILVDTILDTEKFSICYMTENMQAGELAAEEMMRQLKNSGLTENDTVQIGIQASSTTSQTVMDRVAGFMGYWVENAPGSWVVLDDVKINDGDTELACSQCIDLMNDYRNLKGIFTCNNSTTVGTVNGITSQMRTDIVLVGFDYSDEMKDMIESGEYYASTMLQREYYMGYYGVRYAAGNITEGVKFFDTGITVVNNENVDTPEIQSALSQKR